MDSTESKSIKVHFFEKREFVLIAVIASILTIIQIIFFACFTIFRPDTQYTGSHFIVSQVSIALCVLSICIIAIFLQRKNEKLIQKNEELDFHIREKTEEIIKKLNLLENISNRNHNINHDVRDLNNCLFLFLVKLITDKNYPQNNETSEIIGEFKDFLNHYIANIKAVFDCLTNANCSVYISLLSAEDKKNPTKLMVSTYNRDIDSKNERSKIDAECKYYELTSFAPFRDLMNIKKNNSAFNNSVFKCDDCRQLSNFCDRIDNWNEYYTACITVPIRALRSDKGKTHSVIGFLTIDNKVGGLANKNATELLCSYADVLYTPFRMYTDIDEILDSQVL